MRLGALVIGFTLSLVGSARAVMLCARPRSDGSYSTAVKIREVCKSSETQLDPVALGLGGSRIVSQSAKADTLPIATSPAFTTVLTNSFSTVGPASTVVVAFTARVYANAADLVFIRARLDGSVIHEYFGASTPAGDSNLAMPGTFYLTNVPAGGHTITVEMQHNTGSVTVDAFQAVSVVTVQQ
jgi:hypothetical protein